MGFAARNPDLNVLSSALRASACAEDLTLCWKKWVVSMEGFPGGMMGPMGPGMMMHPGMMGMDLPFPGQASFCKLLI